MIPTISIQKTDPETRTENKVSNYRNEGTYTLEQVTALLDMERERLLSAYKIDK